MKHDTKKGISEAAALLGKRARGVPKTITEKDRERRREHMRRVARERWARIKGAAKLLIAAALVGVAAMTAHAIPLSVLLEQERTDIEAAMKLHQQQCSGTTSQACAEQRDALVKSLNILISDATEESDTDMPKMKARALALIAWAREQLKAVAQ
jgi:hypothetical protein